MKKLFLSTCLLLFSITVESQVIHPGCQENCGGVQIPYPFGIQDGCFLEENFQITCSSSETNSSVHPMWQGYSVQSISIGDADMRVFTFISTYCYTRNGTLAAIQLILWLLHTQIFHSLTQKIDSFALHAACAYNLAPFIRIKMFRVKFRFTVVGCDTYSWIRDGDVRMGCMSICPTDENLIQDDDCSGIGCCYTSIPKGLYNLRITSGSFNNHTEIWNFNNCSFSFLVAIDYYTYKINDLHTQSLRERDLVPTVMDWSIGNQTCQQGQRMNSYVCGMNSICSNSDNGSGGYNCLCSPGYQGNPNLPNGCKDVDECQDLSHKCVVNSKCINTEASYQCSCLNGYTGNGTESCIDIDECQNSSHKCVNNSKCVNTEGDYQCLCQLGYTGDGRENCTDIDECSRDPKPCKGHCINTIGAYSCSPDHSLAINLTVGIGVASIVVIVGSIFVYWIHRKREYIKLKEKFFQQNGGFLLQQLVERKEFSSNIIKIFTTEELQTATKNYNDSLIAGRGGYGTVYKGTLPDGTSVAIKKPKQTDLNIDEEQIKQFISEVAILGQVNNKNIVHLHGCCLETPSPILVYEFVTNGTLYEHLQKGGTLSWDTRLKVATQTAQVLSYLHSQAVTPVIHRDIKSTNILLDENFNAKVSDFGASRLVASDELQVCTMVQGTLGYLDPEYLQTSQLTEKSDVYSFGVVLVELLTGQRAVRFDKSEEERSLVKYFLSALQQNLLHQALEYRVLEEGNIESLQEVAYIAMRCLRLKGEERPSMKQVEMELEGLTSSFPKRHSSAWVGAQPDLEEESVYLLGEGLGEYSDIMIGSADDSIRNQVSITIISDGR